VQKSFIHYLITHQEQTIEQARLIDDKLISVWTGHPHLRVIDKKFDFENKMKKLIIKISAFLGEPFPYEIERKFLIEYPDIEWLTNLPNCERIEIIQTYLKMIMKMKNVFVSEEKMGIIYILKQQNEKLII